jgi:hypothetical protein
MIAFLLHAAMFMMAVGLYGAVMLGTAYGAVELGYRLGGDPRLGLAAWSVLTVVWHACLFAALGWPG